MAAVLAVIDESPGVGKLLYRVPSPEPSQRRLVAGKLADKLQIFTAVAGVCLACGAVYVAVYYSIDWGMLSVCHDVLLGGGVPRRPHDWLRLSGGVGELEDRSNLLFDLCAFKLPPGCEGE